MTVLKLPYTQFNFPPSEAFPAGGTVDYPVVKTSIALSGLLPTFWFLSVIDSGADHCVLPAVMGRQLGLDIEAGKKVITAGVTGTGITYFHSVQIFIDIQGQQYNFSCFTGFMTGLDATGIGLLGRNGFFSLFHKVSFDNDSRFVELTPKQPQATP